MTESAEKIERKAFSDSFLLSGKIKSIWSRWAAVDFWGHEGSLSDHLGILIVTIRFVTLKGTANERTYHNWLALSNTTSWMGVVITQMSKIAEVVRLEHHYMLRYNACVCQALSIAILTLGTCRFFCEQNAIQGLGKRSSQWTLLAAGLLILLVSDSFGIA